MSEKLDIPRSAEQKHTIEQLQNIGQEYADIYEVACQEFGLSSYLRDVQVHLDFSRGTYTGGIVEDRDTGEKQPVVVLGMAPNLTSRNFVEGVVTRLGANPELTRKGLHGESLARMAAFAHELGHIVQKSPQYESKFGELSRGKKINSSDYTDEEYRQYVEADTERNADFIAAVILSRCDIVNRWLKIEKPPQALEDWREWVAEHPVVIGGAEMTDRESLGT